MDSPHSHYLQSNQVTVKSLLAKLVAMENITVVQDSRAKTALFHTKDRVLILPKWQGMTPHIYTLLMFHEVGHALHTPNTSFKKLRGKRPSIYIDILQIVEDARIEKKMKRKFPGVVRSFRIGYQEMIQLGIMSLPPVEAFIGPDGKPDGRSFLDRLLIHTKAGAYIDFRVPFLDEEIPFVYGAEEAEDFKQVEEVSQAILEYLMQFAEKSTEQRKSKSPPKESDPFSGGGGSSDDENEDESEEDEDDEDSDGGDDEDEDNESSGKKDGEEDEEEEKSDSPSSGGDEDDEDSEEGEGEEDSDEEESLDDKDTTEEDFKSLTSQLLQDLKDKLSDLTEADDKDSDEDEDDEDSFQDSDEKGSSNSHQDYDDEYYGEVTFDTSRISSDQFVNHYREANMELFDGMYSKISNQDKADLDVSLRSFINRTAKVVNTMVMEFNLKKAARDTKRIAVAKKGVLDTDRLHAYKYSDSVFKSHMVTKTGKSHGVIVFLDQSGSMESCILYSVLQLFNLVMFCQGAKIPFEVYGFCDGGPLKNTGHSGVIDVRRDLVLNNYLSNKMSQTEINFAMRNLLVYALSNDRLGYGKLSVRPNTPKNHQLGGTPLDATILVSKDLFWKFKARNNLDIVHCIYITDGCSDQGVVTGSIYSSPSLLIKNGPFLYPYGHDSSKSTPGDAESLRYKTTESVLGVLRDETDCKAISFFLCNNSRSLGGCREYNNVPHGDRGKVAAEFEDRGYVEIPSCYDKMFVVNPSLLAFDEGVTGSDIFRNQMKARPFLSSFIQVISKA